MNKKKEPSFVVGMAGQLKRREPHKHGTNASDRALARKLLEPKTSSAECLEVATPGYN